MIKIGDKVYHWASSDEVGEAVFIVKEKTNRVMTSGGTMQSRTYVIVQYKSGERKKILSSELQKHFD